MSKDNNTLLSEREAAIKSAMESVTKALRDNKLSRYEQRVLQRAQNKVSRIETKLFRQGFQVREPFDIRSHQTRAPQNDITTSTSAGASEPVMASQGEWKEFEACDGNTYEIWVKKK